MNYLDLIVGAASVAEVALYYTDSSVRNLAILRVTLALFQWGGLYKLLKNCYMLKNCYIITAL